MNEPGVQGVAEAAGAASVPAVAARRVRHTLPPKAALAALRVDAAGRVVEGLEGYYWYGEAVVLATDAAEYLLGGASVPHAAVVALAAVVDAKRWRAERGGMGGVSGVSGAGSVSGVGGVSGAGSVGGVGGAGVAEDWAVRAWGAAVHESALVEYATRRLGEVRAWGVYRAALAEAIAALARRG